MNSGKGTSFKLYLPRVDAPLHVPVLSSNPRQERGSETILVVVAGTILGRLGYRILTAPHGQKALEIMSDFDGNVDLLITDMIMPGMNGHELAGALQARFLRLRVLYMSGYTDGAIMHQGELQEGAHFIGKPFSAAALSIKVREVLDQSNT